MATAMAIGTQVQGLHMRKSAQARAGPAGPVRARLAAASQPRAVRLTPARSPMLGGRTSLRRRSPSLVTVRASTNVTTTVKTSEGDAGDDSSLASVPPNGSADLDADAGKPGTDFMDAPNQIPDNAAALQNRTLAVLFSTYCAVYFARKPLSVVKAPMQESLGLSTATIGAIDSAFLGCYAFGQLVLPSIGDRVGAKNVLVIGYIVAAAAVLGFGMTSVPMLLIATWALNGLGQALAHPLTVKLLSPWFSPAQRGTAMGIWASSQQVGGVLSTALAAYLLGIIGWRLTVVAPAAMLIASAALLMAVDLDPPWSKEPKKALNASGEKAEVPSFLAVLKIPKLKELMMSFFCVKIVRYCLIFWLPFYLAKELGMSAATAGYMSCAFDFGGIAGGLLTGILCDKYFQGRRPLVGAMMCAFLVAAILAYRPACAFGAVANIIVMGLVGFFVAGPDALLGAAAISDTCENAGYGPEVLGTASGLVNGAGSVGAVVQGVLTAWIADTYGWGALFFSLATVSALGVVSLLAATPSKKEPATA